MGPTAGEEEVGSGSLHPRGLEPPDPERPLHPRRQDRDVLGKVGIVGHGQELSIPIESGLGLCRDQGPDALRGQRLDLLRYGLLGSTTFALCVSRNT
jgi:hypothetical protein